jgi:hypothetical protein
MVLAMLVTWAIAAMHSPTLRRSAIVTLALLVELLVPNNFVPMLLRHVRVLDGLATTRWWQTMVEPHHAWAILLLAAWTTGLYLKLHERARVPRSAGSAVIPPDEESDLSGAVSG